jgi:hypothetical protein
MLLTSNVVLWHREATKTFCFPSAGSRFLIFVWKTAILNEGWWEEGTKTEETAHTTKI